MQFKINTKRVGAQDNVTSRVSRGKSERRFCHERLGKRVVNGGEFSRAIVITTLMKLPGNQTHCCSRKWLTTSLHWTACIHSTLKRLPTQCGHMQKLKSRIQNCLTKWQIISSHLTTWIPLYQNIAHNF